jgi:hypothetical protein
LFLVELLQELHELLLRLPALLFLCLTCSPVKSCSFCWINACFHCWFCLQSFLNTFIRFLLLNYEKKLAPRCLMHHRLCKSCDGVSSLGPASFIVFTALSIPACLS